MLKASLKSKESSNGKSTCSLALYRPKQQRTTTALRETFRLRQQGQDWSVDHSLIVLWQSSGVATFVKLDRPFGRCCLSYLVELRAACTSISSACSIAASGLSLCRLFLLARVVVLLDQAGLFLFGRALLLGDDGDLCVSGVNSIGKVGKLSSVLHVFFETLQGVDLVGEVFC